MLGGLLNVANAWLAERRKERRDRRAAARMLIPELVEARRALWMMQYFGDWTATGRFERARWELHEANLARFLDDDTWSDLSSIYLSLSLFEDENPLAVMDEDDELPLHLPAEATAAELEKWEQYRAELAEFGDEDREHIGLTLDVLDHTIRRLAGIAGVRVSAIPVDLSTGSA